MDWQKQLYPGLWCILFIITGLLIRIIKLISGSEDQEMIIVYYACFVASVVALCFLIINVATVITEGATRKRGLINRIHCIG